MKQKPELTAIRLYSDGHAILSYQKEDPDAGPVNYVEAIERLVDTCRFTGMIKFDDQYYPLLKLAIAVRATDPSLASTSEALKQLGVVTGSVRIILKEHLTRREYSGITFHTFPDHLATGITQHPDINESWDEIKDTRWWHNDRIARYILIEQKERKQEAA